MQIHSQFKDYYDHIAHLYGGGDPSIQYIRNRLVPLSQTKNEVTMFSGALNYHQAGLRMQFLCHRFVGMSFKWLVVCAKQYLLVSQNGILGDYKILSQELHAEVWEYVSKKSRWIGDNLHVSDCVGGTSVALLELIKKVGAPVFTYTVDRNDVVTVDGEIPILGNIGLPKLISAQTLYQDLSYFMGNVIKESPDMQPPSKMTDKEKIDQHGFDQRISFRHRV